MTSRTAPPNLDILRTKIWSHPFEKEDQSQDMVRRLAIEQGWNIEEAKAAVEEYRRFCFLACAAGHPVTPSNEVDAVWHLHLVHTHDYWKIFCPLILGRELHHGPTAGGILEEHRYYDQYAQTLRSYQHFFGAPPRRWWPPAAERFQPIKRWRWVYRADYWVIPKPWRWLKRLLPHSNKENQ